MISHYNLLANIAFMGNFKNLSLGVNDWIDFLIITILIYIVIRVLSETHSLSVAIGILSLSALYAASAVFNLPLTHLVLQTLFGILLIFIAIIFQKELRRLFSFVGFFTFRKHVPPNEATIATVVRTVMRLSQTKTGALIVFPGKESILRFLEGGIALRGDISEELLMSIFDESTPGHDGAVVIEDNKIKKFAVHLPLAEDLARLGKSGLRHRAAVGLSERSDALVIVVSGESGRIDVARHNALEQCADEAALRQKLLAFYGGVVSRSRWNYFFEWSAHNAFSVGASLIIAFIVWLFFIPEFTLVQKKFTVPLEFQNVSSTYVIQDAIPREAVLTLQGQSLNFESLAPQSLEAVVDLSSIHSLGWHEISLKPSGVDVPINFSLVDISPQTIEVEIADKNQ
jgi:diadenylate cyclase